MPCISQSMFQRTDNQAPDQSGIAKTHFGLGRMHINIHLIGGQFQKQRQHRMPIPGQKIHIGTPHSPLQQFILHRPTIDEQELMLGIAPVKGGQPRKSGQVQIFPFHINFQGILFKFTAQYRRKTPQAQLCRVIAQFGNAAGDLKYLPFIIKQGKSHIWAGHGQAFDDILCMAEFCTFSLEKLQPRRGGEKQIAHFHRRALGTGRRF